MTNTADNEVRFGNEEWFRKLNELVSFPGIFAFYISNDKSVHVKKVETKAERPESMLYRLVKPSSYSDGFRMALAGAKRIHSPQEYFEECKRVMDAWGIVPPSLQKEPTL
ncbi:hypothetical protein ACFSR7_35965 [Cohnella sp. GCM10020058]|uniref:hypothetical protein n=1 Tax=Cohnella sp. GCM10020058 TaxID=3317330 RepID=UPI00363EC267